HHVVHDPRAIGRSVGIHHSNCKLYRFRELPWVAGGSDHQVAWRSEATLLVVKIHLRVGIDIQSVLMYVADDAGNRVPGYVRLSGPDFEALAERVASGEIAFRHGLIDH